MQNISDCYYKKAQAYLSIDTVRCNCCFHGIYVLYLCWEPNVEQVSFFFSFFFSVAELFFFISFLFLFCQTSGEQERILEIAQGTQKERQGSCL